MKDSNGTWVRYRYGDPRKLGVEWDNSELSEEEIKFAGFDPDDSELGFGTLTENWNGHEAGSRVVSGATLPGFFFAVEARSRS